MNQSFLERVTNARVGRYAPSMPAKQSQGAPLPVSADRMVRLTSACCPQRKSESSACQDVQNCSCPSCQSARQRQNGRYTDSGFQAVGPQGMAPQGNMMLPNITINVQSQNRESSDYIDEHDQSTRYQSEYRSSKDPVYAPQYAPESYQNNPTFMSSERGNSTSTENRSTLLWPGRTELPSMGRYDTPALPPVIASKQVTARAQENQRRIRGLPPERVAQRFYKEFP